MIYKLIDIMKMSLLGRDIKKSWFHSKSAMPLKRAAEQIYKDCRFVPSMTIAFVSHVYILLYTIQRKMNFLKKYVKKPYKSMVLENEFFEHLCISQNFHTFFSFIFIYFFSTLFTIKLWSTSFSYSNFSSTPRIRTLFISFFKISYVLIPNVFK